MRMLRSTPIFGRGAEGFSGVINAFIPGEMFSPDETFAINFQSAGETRAPIANLRRILKLRRNTSLSFRLLISLRKFITY